MSTTTARVWVTVRPARVQPAAVGQTTKGVGSTLALQEARVSHLVVVAALVRAWVGVLPQPELLLAPQPLTAKSLLVAYLAAAAWRRPRVAQQRQRPTGRIPPPARAHTTRGGGGGDGRGFDHAQPRRPPQHAQHDAVPQSEHSPAVIWRRVRHTGARVLGAAGAATPCT